jgi:hypothetical protein
MADPVIPSATTTTLLAYRDELPGPETEKTNPYEASFASESANLATVACAFSIAPAFFVLV